MTYHVSIMQEQVQGTLDSWTEDISKCFNSGTIAELTASSYKGTTLKGIAWNIKMLLLLCKEYFPEAFWSHLLNICELYVMNSGCGNVC